MLSSDVVLVVILIFSECRCADPDLSDCEVAAKTEQGFVCGRTREATNGVHYASFRGIPYAKQPLGELRFKELQPAEPFNGVFNATEDGPQCAQVDVTYEPRGLVPPKFSEGCIHLNIHVPRRFLPDPKDDTNSSRLLPILLWIHGGSFCTGSGDADFQGPEYLMTKEMILITINYRLNALGFLSLDNEYIPGNNGLRDAITALKWVQRNIINFGGDPEKVTVGGQSSGGAMAHLLSISPATKGLFKKVIALSGQAIAGFYAYSPAYAKLINNIFFIAVGINHLQAPKKVYDDLVAAPIEKIIHGQKIVSGLFGGLSFAPVIEKPRPELTTVIPRDPFTTVIPRDPQELLDEGAGKEYPILIGFCSNEAAVFRKGYEKANLTAKLSVFPTLTLPPNLLFLANPFTLPDLTAKHLAEYFSVTSITVDKYIVSATDSYYKYPAFRLTQKRLSAGAANTFIYEFGYPGEKSPIKKIINDTYPGAGHIEDLTYFLRYNALLGPQTEANELDHSSADNRMKDWMTTFISNFIIKGSPVDTDHQWLPCQSSLKFQNIEEPLKYNFTNLTPYLKEKLNYFTRLYNAGLVE